jgi:hypothetical protein
LNGIARFLTRWYYNSRISCRRALWTLRPARTLCADAVHAIDDQLLNVARG